MVTRDMEWANVVVGYRQEHRYVLTDPQEKSAVIGFVIEKSHWLFRQFLRSRRPFKATVMDKAVEETSLDFQQHHLCGDRWKGYWVCEKQMASLETNL